MFSYKKPDFAEIKDLKAEWNNEFMKKTFS